jgi:dihydroorotate dehydrogenase (fumarate)
LDLATEYLGLRLAHPFMPGASPLTGSLDGALRLEDAGASAIVLPSLFEEQLDGEFDRERDVDEIDADLTRPMSSRAARTNKYEVAAERYLRHVSRLRHRVHVPLIASLNGTTAEGWLEHARFIERAGADALELNFYHVATDPLEDAWRVERRVIDIVAVLKESIGIPIAVKLSPFYSSLPNLAFQLEQIGADGLVLFNRFYQPDIDPEGRSFNPHLELSSSAELLLRLHWLAILAGQTRSSLAASGGVHEPVDAIKAIMAGADAVQLVSALLRYGPAHLKRVRCGVQQWAEEHGFTSFAELRGSVKLAASTDLSSFERRGYVRTLHSWPTLSGSSNT